MKKTCSILLALFLACFSALPSEHEVHIEHFVIYNNPILGRSWLVIASGEVGRAYVLETSTDLIVWERQPGGSFNQGAGVGFTGPVGDIGVRLFRVIKL